MPAAEDPQGALSCASASGGSFPGECVLDGKDASLSSGLLQESLILREFPGAFRVRRRLVGDGGRNFQFIKDTTGASVLCTHAPNRLLLYAESEEALQQAVVMARHLVSTVEDEFALWRDGRGVSSGAPGSEARRQLSGTPWPPGPGLLRRRQQRRPLA